MEPEREDNERLQDTYTHLNAAETELRNALQAALDEDAPADLLRKIASAMANVSYLIPWALNFGERESEATS
jgi:hypothetical protein